jgi:ketosteroid isomerase-like protein
MHKKRWFKILILITVLGVVIFLVFKKKKTVNIAEDKATKCLELMSIDRDFSKMSEQEGMKSAFIEFIDSNGVMLRSNSKPFVGANAIDYLIQQDDKGYSLSLDPHHAEMAESGEMGFTYGIYRLQSKSMDTAIFGTYANVWKKQQDGKWKLLLNTSNEGVEQ